MSKPDMNKIKYGARVAIPRDEIAAAKTHNIITYRQDQQAADLGVLIAKNKGWKTQAQGDLHVSDLDIYVFTLNELRDFIDAKIKQKLIEMAKRDTEKDIADRLLLLSERV